MPRNFWKMVNDVIEEADILILLLDARLIKETRNPEVESKVIAANKPLIYVITKSDLVRKETLERRHLTPSVFISAKDHLGTTILRNRILMEGKKAYKNKKDFKVGVLGYPNVGKSSLINAMKGKRAAPSSSVSGFTKGIQMVRADSRLIFLDTPGVIPYMEKNNTKHAFIGTIDFNKVKEPDIVVIELMKKYPGEIEAYYKVKTSDDVEASIELIAKKRSMLRKGGTPDVERAARMILKEWQTGKIK